jgi:hypothetical protein
MSTGTEVWPRTSFTEPRHRKLVLLWIGRTIAIRVGLITFAPMFKVSPPQRDVACPRTNRDDVATSGGPCDGTKTLNGVLASCWQVSTCVNPRKLDMLMGISIAPSKANNATRERRMAGTTSSLCVRARLVKDS